MHSQRLDVSKYVHWRQEWSSKPHFGHLPIGSEIEVNRVPHCAQRETVCVPGICSARGPKVSFFTGLSVDCFCRSSSLPRSWYPCWRYFCDTRTPLCSDIVSLRGEVYKCSVIYGRTSMFFRRFAARNKRRGVDKLCWVRAESRFLAALGMTIGVRMAIGRVAGNPEGMAIRAWGWTAELSLELEL